MSKPPQLRPRIRPRRFALAGAPGRPEDFLAHELLSTLESSEYLRIPLNTLKHWRKRRSRAGPRFIRAHAHKVLYRLRDLEHFLDERTIDPAAKRCSR